MVWPYNRIMAMGTRKMRERQEELWYGGELPKAPGHPFYQRLNEVLDAAKFDSFCETACAGFYHNRLGRPSLPPGQYFRVMMIGLALAITSFPVPVSPWIKTAESTGATLSTSVNKARNFGLDPIKSKVVIPLLLYEVRSLLRFPLIKPACASFHCFVSRSTRGRMDRNSPARCRPLRTEQEKRCRPDPSKSYP